MIYSEDVDRAVREKYANDLEGFDDDDLIDERDEVQDRVSEDTEWLEALCAEMRHRGLEIK